MLTKTLQLTGDSYLGAPIAVISLDGVAIDEVTVTATQGATPQTYDVQVPDGYHTISVHLLADAYGGSPTKDRNLYVIDNGTAIKLGTEAKVYTVRVNGGNTQNDILAAINSANDHLSAIAKLIPSLATAPAAGTTTATPSTAAAAPTTSNAPQGWQGYAMGPDESIADALSKAGAKPVLTLKKGVYKQVFNVPTGLDGFVIQSETGNPADVVLDGQGGVTVAQNNQGSAGGFPTRLAWGKGVAHCQVPGTFTGITFTNGGSNATDGHDGQAGLYWDCSAADGTRGTAVARNCIFDHNQNGVFGNTTCTNTDFVLENCLFTRNGTDGGSHDTYIVGINCTLALINNIFPGSNSGNDSKNRVSKVTVKGGFFGSQNANRWVESADGSETEIDGGIFVANDLGQNLFGNGTESTSKGPGNTVVNNATFYIGNRSANFSNAGSFQANGINLFWTGPNGSIFNDKGQPLNGLPASPPAGTAFVPYPAVPSYDYTGKTLYGG